MSRGGSAVCEAAAEPEADEEGEGADAAMGDEEEDPGGLDARPRAPSMAELCKHFCERGSARLLLLLGVVAPAHRAQCHPPHTRAQQAPWAHRFVFRWQAPFCFSVRAQVEIGVDIEEEPEADAMPTAGFVDTPTLVSFLLGPGRFVRKPLYKTSLPIHRL